MPARNRVDDEPVDVLVRVEQDRELPELVVADGQLWSVRQIVTQELAQQPPPGELGEHVWWVVVAAGRSGREHIWALGQAYPSGRWRIRSAGEHGPLQPSGRASR